MVPDGRQLAFVLALDDSQQVVHEHHGQPLDEAGHGEALECVGAGKDEAKRLVPKGAALERVCACTEHAAQLDPKCEAHPSGLLHRLSLA